MKCWISLLLTAIVSIQCISAQPTKLYVGNLPWTTTGDNLREIFKGYGRVLEAIVVIDRDTGHSKGFGFVTMATEIEAHAALVALDEKMLDGRHMKLKLTSA